MSRLHPDSLSPDPTFGRAVRPCGELANELDLEPYRIVRAVPALSAWNPPVRLPAPANGRVELLLDFGTELDAVLELVITTTSLCNVIAFFGESEVEAENLILAFAPHPIITWHVPGAGTHTKHFDSTRWLNNPIAEKTARGFRFVRLVFHDVHGELRIDRLVAHAKFTFTERRGDFRCDDKRFQRAWQASVYTARLCTQPDSLWDGIKRDRHGWYGDARITAETNDAVWHEPMPVAKMLALLPTDNWCNGIPGFSFDAIAMLHQQVLAFGTEAPGVRDTFAKVGQFLDWVAANQTNADGFIIRDGTKKIWTYFEEIGFLDWSPVPLGGRFEELSWLQAKYVGGLRHAARLARWLDDSSSATRWQQQAERLEKLIGERFWSAAAGFIHTLNHVGPCHALKDHYQKTYVEKIALGPSGASRQCNAVAVLAGIGTDAQRQIILDRVFRNPAIAPIITPYFRYYEDCARALCGDPGGALEDMVGYIGDMVEREDAASIWEAYDPSVRDLRRYSNGRDVTWHWPTSLCHGWSSGLVPLTQRYLLGIEPVQPGFTEVRLQPATTARWSFEATVPTPHGGIRVWRDAATAPVHYKLPAGIKAQLPAEGVIVERGD